MGPSVYCYAHAISDDSTFKDILRFICEHELLQVKAIVWNILPNVRRDALLTKQARLIDLFKPKEIWHNVLIICKQSRNPEDDAQGALAACRYGLKNRYDLRAPVKQTQVILGSIMQKLVQQFLDILSLMTRR